MGTRLAPWSVPDLVTVHPDMTAGMLADNLETLKDMALLLADYLKSQEDLMLSERVGDMGSLAFRCALTVERVRAGNISPGKRFEGVDAEGLARIRKQYALSLSKQLSQLQIVWTRLKKHGVVPNDKNEYHKLKIPDHDWTQRVHRLMGHVRQSVEEWSRLLAAEEALNAHRKDDPLHGYRQVISG